MPVKAIFIEGGFHYHIAKQEIEAEVDMNRESIKRHFNTLMHCFPIVGSIIYRVYFLPQFKFNTKSIRGNNKTQINHAIFNGVKITINGLNNKIVVNDLAILNCVYINISGNNNTINIDKFCRISETTLWIEDDGCAIAIGSETTIGGAHIAATENYSRITIGKDCMFAQDIEIRTGDSHAIYDNNNKRINKAENVYIGDHVWIGTKAIILKGAIIGNGSIIASGSVLTKNKYTNNCIVAGNPARTVKEEISWTRSRNI